MHWRSRGNSRSSRWSSCTGQRQIHGVHTWRSIAHVVVGILAICTTVGASSNVIWKRTSEAWPSVVDVEAQALTASDGKLYVISAAAGPGGLFEYDIAWGSWTRLPLPGDSHEAWSGAPMAASGGKLYVFGISGSNGMHEFDIASRTWTDLSSLTGGTSPSTSIGRMAASDGKLYVGTVASTLHEFDIASRMWTDLSSPTISISYNRIVMAASNGKLYVAGPVHLSVIEVYGYGADGTWERAVLQPMTIAEYDIASRTWTAVLPAPGQEPTERGKDFGMTASNGKLYIYGGTPSQNIRAQGVVDARSPVHPFRSLNMDDLFEYDIQSHSWNDLSLIAVGTAPSEREHIGLVESKGKLYVIGASEESTHLHEYDVELGIWAGFVPFSDGTSPPLELLYRFGLGMAVSENKLYVFGGSEYFDLYEHDVALGTWTPRAFAGTPPSARFGLGMAASNGKLFVFGGLAFEGVVNDLHEFDTVSGTWTDFSSLIVNISPSPRAFMGMVASNGKLYIFAGSGEYTFNDLHELDIASRTWTDLSVPAGGDPPSARESFGMAASNGKLYVFGGVGLNESSAFGDLHEYDAALSMWTNLSSPTEGTPPSARLGLGMAASNEKLYVFGGFDFAEYVTENLNDLHEYNTAFGTWTELPSTVVTPPALQYMGIVTSNGKLFVVGGYSTSNSTAILSDFVFQVHFVVDECKDGTAKCDLNATCADTIDSFDCWCTEGYTGNGLICADEDECDMPGDRSSCASQALCTNTEGSYSCDCLPGFRGDPKIQCYATDAILPPRQGDRDECAETAHNCDRNAECTNNAGSFSCSCYSGFSGDGTTCVQSDKEASVESGSQLAVLLGSGIGGAIGGGALLAGIVFAWSRVKRKGRVGVESVSTHNPLPLAQVDVTVVPATKIIPDAQDNTLDNAVVPTTKIVPDVQDTNMGNAAHPINSSQDIQADKAVDNSFERNIVTGDP